MCSPKIFPNVILLFVRTLWPSLSHELNTSWSWTVGQTEHLLPELWETVTTTYSVFSFYLLPVCSFKVADLLWWQYFLFCITPVDLADHKGRWQVSLIKKHLLCVCIFLDQSITMLQHWSHGHLLLRGSEWLDIAVLGAFLLCMSSSGTVQLAGILDQCSCGIPAEQTNMAACSLHMQMCPVSFTDASELSSSRSLRQWTSHSACQAHTYANNRHTHKHWLSKPNRKERHNRDKYVTASGWDCYHPIEEAVLAWGKKPVCLLILTLCVFTGTSVCLYNPTEFVKKEPKWFMVMMYDGSCIKPSQSSPCRVF